MSLRTAMSKIGAEACVFASTPEMSYGAGMPTLFSVGYGGTSTSALTGETGAMLRGVAAELPTLSIEAGGLNTFGNDAAIAAIEAAAQAFRTKHGPRTPPFFLIGLSMGFADLLAWARQHPTEVAGAIGVVGLTDLTEQQSANRDLGGGVMGAAAINAAYGGAYVPATHAPTHSPIAYAASLPFEIDYFYGTADALIPTSSALAFSALPNVTGHDIGPVAHGTPAIAASRLHPAFGEAVRRAAALAA